MTDIYSEYTPYTSPTNKTLVQGDEPVILDYEWSRRSFLLGRKDYSHELADKKVGQDPKDLPTDLDAINSTFTTADFKFTDTTIGGSIGVGSRPQYSRFSDVRHGGLIEGRDKVSLDTPTGDHGIGRIFSEKQEDNTRHIYLRFGVEQFNSLSGFLTSFVDPQLSSLARTGTGTSVMYKIGASAGYVSAFLAFPAITAGVLVLRTANFFFMRHSSRFYTVKPTMPLYWSAVNNIVNSIATNRGLLHKKLMSTQPTQKVGENYKLDTTSLDAMAEMFPDIFTKNYGIDCLAMANRAQILANRKLAADFEALDKGNSNVFTGYLRKQGAEKPDKKGSEKYNFLDRGTNRILKLLKKAGDLEYYTDEGISGAVGGSHERAEAELHPAIDPSTGEKKKRLNTASYLEYLKSEFDQGAEFAIFQVEHTSTISESFSNNVTESSLQTGFNAASATGRSVSFNLAHGNAVGGIMGKVQGVVGGVIDSVEGFMDTATLGLMPAVMSMMKGVDIDIQKRWESSAASLPTASYKMSLRCPYNNVISHIKHFYLPIGMLLSGTAARKTGNQSHTGPFLCQLFDKGRHQFQVAMITGLTISRGEGNLGWDKHHHALGIDVTFEVTSLDPLLSVAISSGSMLNALFPDRSIDEDNAFSDYLAVLAGQGILEQMYAMPKSMTTLSKQLKKWDNATSSAAWASFTHEMRTSTFGNIISLGVPSVLDALGQNRTAN